MRDDPDVLAAHLPARILVVDDDERNLLALSEVLEPIAEVVTVSSGRDALRRTVAVLARSGHLLGQLLDIRLQLPDIGLKVRHVLGGSLAGGLSCYGGGHSQLLVIVPRQRPVGRKVPVPLPP